MITIRFYHDNELKPFTEVRVSEDNEKEFENMMKKLCAYAAFHGHYIQTSRHKTKEQ